MKYKRSFEDLRRKLPEVLLIGLGSVGLVACGQDTSPDEPTFVPANRQEIPSNTQFENCVWQIENISNKIATEPNLDPEASCAMYLD